MSWFLGCVLISVVLIEIIDQMVLRTAELMQWSFEDLYLILLHPFLCPIAAALSIYAELYAQLH